MTGCERLLSVKAQAPKIALLGGDVVAIESFLHEQICEVLTLADEGPKISTHEK